MSEIVKFFDEICEKNNEKIAFYYRKNGKISKKTFADVKKDVLNCQAQLHAEGVKSGDHILAFATSGYDLITYILASFRIGAVVMYVDILAQQDTLESFFKKHEPKYVFVSNKTQYIRHFFKLLKGRKIINVEKTPTKHGGRMTSNIADDAPALLTYTTGSTTVPKAVVRTHGDLKNQLHLVKTNFRKCQREEVILTTSYMYILANLLQGFTTVLPNLNLIRSSRHLNKVLSTFSNLPINVIITSPDFCLKTRNYYPDLEYLYFGGAILNLYEAKHIKQKFPASENIIIYGCTECNLIATNNLNSYIEKLERDGDCSLGQPVDGVKIKIGDNNEIIVSSYALLEQKKDYNVGDIGRLKDGELFYLGKANNILESCDNKVYANQVEQDLVVKFGLTKCAFLENNNDYYLFIQDRVNKKLLEKYIENKYGFIIIIKKLRRIPCDIKHHTKINYKRLRRYAK